MRFGLVGTGYWARVTHAPALACTDGRRAHRGLGP